MFQTKKGLYLLKYCTHFITIMSMYKLTTVLSFIIKICMTPNGNMWLKAEEGM